MNIAMAVSALGLMVSVVNIYLFHHSPETQPPRWLKSLCFHYLARCFCFKSKYGNSHVEPLQPKEADGSSTVTKDTMSTLTSSLSIKEDKQIDNKDISLMKEVRDIVSMYLKDLQEQKKVNQVQQQWRNISEVIDHSMSCICIVGVPLTLVVCTAYLSST